MEKLRLTKSPKVTEVGAASETLSHQPSCPQVVQKAAGTQLCWILLWAGVGVRVGVEMGVGVGAGVDARVLLGCVLV